MRYSRVVGWLGVSDSYCYRWNGKGEFKEFTSYQHGVVSITWLVMTELQTHRWVDRMTKMHICTERGLWESSWEESMRRVCFGAWGMNKQNEWFRDWRRCTDCLLSLMKGVDSHARDRSMDKMSVNDCLWWCRDEGEIERVFVGVNGLVMSLKYCQLAWFEEDTEKVEYLRRKWSDFEAPQMQSPQRKR